MQLSCEEFAPGLHFAEICKSRTFEEVENTIQMYVHQHANTVRAVGCIFVGIGMCTYATGFNNTILH
jgi:hypothetical protein